MYNDLIPSAESTKNPIAQALRSIYIGDSLFLRLRFTDETENGIDISNNIIWLSLKKRTAKTKALQLRYTVPDNTDSQSGVVYLHIPAEDTAKLDGTYHIDMKLYIDVGGNTYKTTLMNQSIYFKDSVTQK